MHKVDNAVIMAAGTASRFAPLSFEMHKALITVKGEVLIERQIRQLKEAGVPEIYIVTGYKSEQFDYLKEKFGVKLVHNSEYLVRNNNSSIYAVKDILKNTYLCSSDNYFSENPFESQVSDCYYAAVYADGETKEWCMDYNEEGTITDVKIGGENSWFMLGHTFWDEKFSKKFVEILENEYNLPETVDLLWESIYIKHIKELDMKIRKYSDDIVFEFDTLDELRQFDETYISDTRSELLKQAAKELGCKEDEIVNVLSYKDENNAAAGFMFTYDNKQFKYSYEEKILRSV